MSSKRAVRRRACKGKVRYGTLPDALAEIHRPRSKVGVFEVLNVYRCKFCTGFHVGHMPRKVRRAIAARRGSAA